jgi:predicted transcriptional regulator
MAGRTRTAKDGRVYVTLRLDPDLVDRIEIETYVRAVSRVYLIERAITEWLDENGVAHE